MMLAILTTRNMKTNRSIKLVLLAFGGAGCLAIAFVCGAGFSNGNSGSHAHSVPVRASVVMDSDIITESNEDGTRVLWIWDADGLRLSRYQFTRDGELETRGVYRMDKNGSPFGCRIFDDRKNEIFKVLFGYRKSDGTLVEERIFDMKSKRLNDRGQELPVGRILHVLDAASGETKVNLVDLAAVDLPSGIGEGFRNPFRRE